jgi:hypothetical protein
MTLHLSPLARLWREITFSLCVLNRMQFSAPWQRDATTRC